MLRKFCTWGSPPGKLLSFLGILISHRWSLPSWDHPEHPEVCAYLLQLHHFNSVHSLSHGRLFVRPWTSACRASLSITHSWSSPKLISTESVMPFNHLILCHPLLLSSIFPNIRIFSNESALLIRWPKYWRFSFHISSSNEQSGLISFKMGWLNLLAVQGAHKSLLQHHSSKAPILPQLSL